MRIITRTAVALAGAATLGLGLVAAPATAAPALGDEPVVELATSTFKAGSWGDGVQFTVTEVPEGVEAVELAVGSMGENGGGLVAEPVQAERQVDGSFTGTVLPDADTPPVAPDANGYPVYTASAGYEYTDENGETQYASTFVELTITDGVSVTGPDEATVAELAAGVPLQFAGFNSNETVTGDIRYFNAETGEEESIGDFSATLGENGAGEGVLTITGASVGQQFRVVASGEEGTVSHYITVVEGSDEGGEDGDDETPAPAPEQPRKPERVDTGA
ncbi:hypothetical protein BHE97_12170 [Aeromicrobium sp. PE09-221]|uniref:hypothetical protein n=1 Tax=Aeromicrobium sp. PE09-221 TaxID=1898043 RepID=UPI000B3EAAA7|nr:hypothetical protein [Aeromicrobium sp. PE09-221]OUZ08882.1 hypothetical protein BHE97_12170 [Aeromicrobium sp. PE09-221]